MSEHFIFPVSILIVLIAGVLYFHNHKISPAVLFLSLFLIINSIWALVVSLLIFGGPVWLLAITLNNFAPLYYLSPVLFYFYVRSSLSGFFRFKKKDLLHFIPFLINFIAILPYLLTSYDYKHEVATNLMCNYEAYSRFDFGLFYPRFINQLARPLLFLFYLAFSLWAVRRFLPHFKSTIGEVKLQFGFMIRTITIVVIIFSFFSLAQLFVSLDYFLGTKLSTISIHVRILLYFSSVLYLGIPLYILINPRFLYGLPQAKNSYRRSETEQPVVTENNIDNGKPPKLIVVPDNEIFSQLSEKIMEYITTEKPYLNPKFSVHDICVQLNMPRHHVQYCLNIIINKSFTHLKNEQRVAHAMELMKNSANANLTIDGIGKQSGFASNSNFYASFKEITGMTPNKWMEAPSNSVLPPNSLKGEF